MEMFFGEKSPSSRGKILAYGKNKGTYIGPLTPSEQNRHLQSGHLEVELAHVVRELHGPVGHVMMPLQFSSIKFLFVGLLDFRDQIFELDRQRNWNHVGTSCPAAHIQYLDIYRVSERISTLLPALSFSEFLKLLIEAFAQLDIFEHWLHVFDVVSGHPHVSETFDLNTKTKC